MSEERKGYEWVGEYWSEFDKLDTRTLKKDGTSIYFPNMVGVDGDQRQFGTWKMIDDKSIIIIEDGSMGKNKQTCILQPGEYSFVISEDSDTNITYLRKDHYKAAWE